MAKIAGIQIVRLTQLYEMKGVNIYDNKGNALE